MPDSVCAIVLTYNGNTALLREVLAALVSQTRAVDAICVVDNASDEATPRMLAQEFPKAHTLRMSENIGSSAGFHRGIDWSVQSGYDWTWIFDDDAVPKPDALERLLENRNLAETGIGACRVVNTEGRPISSFITCVRNTDAMFRKIFHSEDLSDIIYCYPFSGLLVHRRKVLETGPVRDDFFFYCDDLDWTTRLAKSAGIAYERSSEIVHPDTQLHTTFKLLGIRVNVIDRRALWKQYYAMRNTIFLLKANHGPYIKVAVVGFLKNVLTRPLFGDAWLTLRIYSKALWDGFRGVSGKRIPPGWMGE